MRHAILPELKKGQYTYNDAVFECERRGEGWHPKQVTGNKDAYIIVRNPVYTKAHRKALRESEAVKRLKMMNGIISEELHYPRTWRLWMDRFEEWKKIMDEHQNPNHVWKNGTVVGDLHTFMQIELNRMWKAGETDPVRPDRFEPAEKRGRVEDIPREFFRPCIDNPTSIYRAATDAEVAAWQQSVSSRVALEGGQSVNFS